MKKKLLGIIGAGSLLAAQANAAAPAWLSESTAEADFADVLSGVAPIALAVVVGVAGVRVAIKLINRGAGK